MSPNNYFLQVRVSKEQKLAILNAASVAGFSKKQLSLFIRQKLLKESSSELIILNKIYQKINGDKK